MKKETNKNKGTFFNRHNFAIHNFCEQGGTKQELNGIFVTPEHTISTDGFTIIKVDTPKDYDLDDFPIIPNKPKPLESFKSFILPKTSATRILSIFKESANLPILDNAVLISNKKETAEIGTTDLENFSSITSQKVIGEFPKYKELFVEKGKHIEITVNPKLLKKIVDFYISFLGTPEKGIKIKIPVKADEPIRFYGERKNGQKAKNLLMTIKEEK